MEFCPATTSTTTSRLQPTLITAFAADPSTAFITTVHREIELKALPNTILRCCGRRGELQRHAPAPVPRWQKARMRSAERLARSGREVQR